MRLIEHLHRLGLSNKQAKAALSSGKVYVANAPTADASRNVESDDVVVHKNAPRTRPWRDPVIVFRDDDLAVVAKPAGLLSVPAASRRGAPSILGFVRKTLGDAHAVHRLDLDTSGLMVVARTEQSQARLKDQFASHDVVRNYLAIVAGLFPASPVRRETRIARDRGDGKRGSTDDPDGRLAISHFERARALGANRSIVRARLETGRTHQIRIHLAELGYPLLGDRIYAAKPLWRAAPRLALHSVELGFTHPSSGNPLSFTAPLADDLERLARQLAGGR